MKSVVGKKITIVDAVVFRKFGLKQASKKEKRKQKERNKQRKERVSKKERKERKASALDEPKMSSKRQNKKNTTYRWPTILSGGLSFFFSGLL